MFDLGLAPEAVKRNSDTTYTVRDDRVLVGSSLGNSSVWLVGKATGAIQKLFSLRLGFDVFWSTVVTYGSPQHHVLVGYESDDRATEERHGQPGGHVILTAVAPGHFTYCPGHQIHTFELPSRLSVTETIFVPRTGSGDPAVAYFMIDVTNGGDETRELIVHNYTKLVGNTPPDIKARYDDALHAIVAANESHPDWVRIVGCTVPPRGYETMHHAAESYDPQNVPPLSNSTAEQGNIIAALSAAISIKPGECYSLAFIEVFSERGEAEARRIYGEAQDARAWLERTAAHYDERLQFAQVLTPDKLINDGCYWAKVNMLRVIADYPQGCAFTNSPGSSSAVVGRDLSWFTIGCDFTWPETSRSMLLRYAQTQYDSGKMPEYYNAITGACEDYGLNINDDTPLFVLACAHYYRVSDDLGFLEEVWPVLCRAVDYILEQRDERGLIVCTATGEEVRGISGWRNIIPHFRINGAVTEINSECYSALCQLAQLARMRAQRQPDQQDACHVLASHYGAAARSLREAINTHLLNPKNGMYLLNIDLDGQPHADVTGDEVFPVMFDVAPAAVAYRIVSRLNTPDFQTEAGLRTVSRFSPDYTPYRDVGLIGGVWPGLSFWYAFAAAKIYPDAMVHNLTQGYAQYLRDPKIFNTVPGQFSEWFDGESLINRGMRLSPWEPPRYLWAAVEGACGLNVEEAPRSVQVAPLMPSGWRWLGVRRLPLFGEQISYFVIRHGRFHVFSNHQLTVDGDLEIFEEDVSDRIERLDPDMEVIAFRRGQEWLVCIGSTLNVAYTFPLSLKRLVDENRRYRAVLYNPDLGRWIKGETASGHEFTDIALRIEAQSFGLTRLVPVE